MEYQDEAGAETSDTAEVNSRAMLASGTTYESAPEAGMSGRGSGSRGIRLECCPMCLMLFPARCDSVYFQVRNNTLAYKTLRVLITYANRGGVAYSLSIQFTHIC